MKCALTLLLVLAFAAMVLADEGDWKQRLKKIHDECQADPDTHVDESILEKLKKHEKVDPHLVEKHLKCMAIKIGWQKEDGTVDAGKVEETLRKVIKDDAKLEEAIKECTKQHETPEKTAFILWGCIRKNMHEALDH